MTAGEVIEYGFEHVALATGSHWRRNGIGRSRATPLPGVSHADVLTPDDVLTGARPQQAHVVVFDDDHYYMGGAVAELLAMDGWTVDLVTPAALISAWTVNTLEQQRIHRRLVEAGVRLWTQHELVEVGVHAQVRHVVTGATTEIPTDSIVLVTSRRSETELFEALSGRDEELEEAGVESLRLIGDALAPGTIAAAVWWGRRFAEEVGEAVHDGVPFRRQLPTED